MLSRNIKRGITKLSCNQDPNLCINRYTTVHQRNWNSWRSTSTKDFERGSSGSRSRQQRHLSSSSTRASSRSIDSRVDKMVFSTVSQVTETQSLRPDFAQREYLTKTNGIWCTNNQTNNKYKKKYLNNYGNV